MTNRGGWFWDRLQGHATASYRGRAGCDGPLGELILETSTRFEGDFMRSQVTGGGVRRLLLAAFVAAALVPSAVRAADKKADPNRWEPQIQAFERQDREQPPPKQAVLFVGSSSIRLWDLKKAFPQLKTINRLPRNFPR